MFKNCQYCKKGFQTKRREQIFCSSKCSVQYFKNNPEHIKKLKESHLGKYKYNIKKEVLENLYVNKKLTIKQCSEILKISYATIRIRLHKLDIPVRTKSEIKLGYLNPMFGKPGPWLGRKHKRESIEKMRKHNLENPRRYWLGKKRPEMALVRGFGDHKGKTFEDIMKNKEKAQKRRHSMSLRFKNNIDIPRKMAIKMISNIDNYKSNTSIEKIIKRELIKIGYKEKEDFIHQYDFLNKHMFLCDFAFPKNKLIIECDGDYWHANPKKYNLKELTKTQIRNLKFDKAKNAYIKKCGWEIIRLWETSIKNDTEECIYKIINKIKESR